MQGLRSVLRDSNQKPNPFNDVSIQADIRVADPTTYESEDELMGMGRRKQLGRSKRGTPLYSKEDIREQYCINDKQLHGLEDIQGTGGLFGCLSSYHVDLSDSSCSSRSPGLLSVCVRRKVPSDENLAELCRRAPHDYAPFPRWPRYFPHDEAVYFRRRPKSLCNDPHGYAWMAEDEEAIRMERPRPIRPDEYEMCNNYPRRGPHYMSYSSEYLVGRHMPCPAHPHLPPPPPPPAIPTMPHRTKHVSFARSHTLTSFDDAIVSIGSGVGSCSQERLIDGKKSLEVLQEPQKIVVEKVKRAPMKTQATQTEVCLGRKPLPPNYLTLSPRTVHRVRMVSQGAQTNGDKNNRRLMKSFSEVGQFGVGTAGNNNNAADSHEPLQRTQSEEPPRSPFLPTSPKEILIDFEPLERRGRKRLLGKTVSDGEILESAREKEERGDGATQSDCEACYQNTSIDEPSEKRSASSAFSGSETTSPVKQLISADSQEEEFHENLIYGSRLFRKQSTGEDADSGLMSMADPKAPPSTKIQSPFASSDSLNTRDHSDGIWNESQTTILHADSDNNGAGTGVSCSDLSSSLTPSAAIMSLTPSSRRKHLLMLQHQQRSSMDTEALDAEDLDIEQPPLSPRVRGEPVQTVPVVAVTTPIQDRTETSKPIIKNTLPYFKTRIEQSLSPSHRARRRSPDLRVADLDNQQNDLLARSDSGKTNTDMSETSTTTEDYATATENNSGTDTSSKLLRGDSGPTTTATSIGVPSATGSSFESGSSLYSLARADATEEVQQVPCSPPPIVEEKEKNNEFSEEVRLKDVDSISGESSSSGSYSVDGSSGEKQLSDRSGACSSPGEYESPVEEHSKSRSWTEEERTEAKRGFKLELSPKKEQASSAPAVITPQRGVFPQHKSPNREAEQEVPKRPKGKTQSPIQPSGKHTPTQVVVSNGMGGESSEDSSGECACGRQRRTRRKSGGRSPTSHNRMRRRSNSGDENNRRRSSLAPKSPSPVAPEDNNTLRTNSRLYPGHEAVRSPGGSPSRRGKPKGITSPDAARLKALSAESLRSVSPGSDSVFYSEHSSATATLTEQATCHHCGRNVNTSPPLAGVVGSGESNGNDRNNGVRETIVQPPAGFADSPRPAHRDRATTPAPRLYKKADKRFRSEERRHQARVHAEAVRAKSEERGREEKKEKVRPLTRSTDASMEKLRCSPSSLCSDDDDCGIYADSYHSSTWVYIGDNEELQVWQRPTSKEDDETSRRDSVDSTGSEREFRRRYQAITHRMVHRKSSLEMYKRLASKSFGKHLMTLSRLY
ncbi:uncharacterized protein LOC124362813 isoform X1 [Homalodisca vitripennis]|uniref:uncharacterized protein LOC124362813 isoform X1 n=1 Tax=Homalodisca vitripennis TaxID=197043 RepID=UPI001EECD322|nr:uncharacterized protein LOC124362813 isoform X1 [Homalodisca vitripennis]